MKLVLVEWEDASEVDDAPWVEKDAEPPIPVIVQQVGFLVRVDKHAIVLTSAHYSTHTGRRERIPRGMVRSIVELDPAASKPLKKSRNATSRHAGSDPSR